MYQDTADASLESRKPAARAPEPAAVRPADVSTPEASKRARPMSGDMRFVSRLTRETLALVMAGGKGTRLMPLAAHRAKPAVPFGGKFRIIDFTLSNCINSGIRKIGVLMQYEGHSLIQHLQQGWSFCRGQFGEFIEMLPAEQRVEAPGWYVGTADAVYQNIDFIRRSRPRYVLILAGDHIYKMDYGSMIAHHTARGADVTVGCVEVPREEASAFGVMQVDASDRIVSFDEKPAQPKTLPGNPDVALASMGIYVFDTEFLLEHLERDAKNEASSHDFGHDIVPEIVDNANAVVYRLHDLYDAEVPGYWRDVGHVDAYWKANMELTEVQPEFDLYDNRWPIWTHQEQVPPAKFVFDRNGLRGMAVDSLVSGGCVVSGATVRRSVLFVGCTVEAGSKLEDSLLLPNVRLGRHCRIRRAVIDEGVSLPDGTVIGEDAAEDARRFEVTPGGVTIVTLDMLRA
ncbi:MAG TPA: glucose-1-phosphate adenylyltransferase [Fontimonas sp.]